MSPMPSSHHVTRARAIAHDTHAKETMEIGCHGLLGPNSHGRVPAGHRLRAIQMDRGRVRHLNQAGQNLRLAMHTESVSSDNGSPFNGQDFSDFSKYLGFLHQQKTPLNLEANAEVE